MLSPIASVASLRIESRRSQQFFLAIQEKEARWWRGACVLYFQTSSGRPVPEGYEPPERTLDELMATETKHVPGM